MEHFRIKTSGNTLLCLIVGEGVIFHFFDLDISLFFRDLTSDELAALNGDGVSDVPPVVEAEGIMSGAMA